MKVVEACLHEQFGDFESRAYVDTGPLVERSLATAAGLGWTGKNTCLIHPKLGSFGFLAVLLTSLEAPEQPDSQQAVATGSDPKPDAPQEPRAPSFRLFPGEAVGYHDSQPAPIQRRHSASKSASALPSMTIPDRCGSCRRCLDACPTNALFAPYQMDASRCISYLTIEHRGPISPELMEGMGRQVFGCDICQDVCPWNRKAPITADSDLAPRPELVNPTLEWLAALDEPQFQRQFNGSPIRRTGFQGLRRNVAIAMGNSRLPRFAAKLEEWAIAADEGLSTAACWALEKLSNPGARY
jgi:epoxyqueuosine reductase